MNEPMRGAVDLCYWAVDERTNEKDSRPVLHKMFSLSGQVSRWRCLLSLLSDAIEILMFNGV